MLALSRLINYPILITKVYQETPCLIIIDVMKSVSKHHISGEFGFNVINGEIKIAIR